MSIHDHPMTFGPEKAPTHTVDELKKKIADAHPDEYKPEQPAPKSEFTPETVPDEYQGEDPLEAPHRPSHSTPLPPASAGTDPSHTKHPHADEPKKKH